MASYTIALQNINKKINLLFILIIIVSFIIFLLFSFVEYTKYKYNPEYYEVLKIDEKFNLDNRYHSTYFKQFIFSNTLSLFFKNLLVISLIIFIFCYSLAINKPDLVTTDNKKIEFARISLHGIYFLIALTILFFLSFEFFIPLLEDRLENMRNNTSRAIISLNKGNELYNNNNYQDALYFYEEYFIIIENDNLIYNRIHEIQNKIKIESFKDHKKALMMKNENVNDSTTYYLELADNNFQKKDFLTALFYYSFIAETTVPSSTYARQRILLIKEILKYNKNLNIKESNKNNTELNKYIYGEDIQIREIYVLKSKADNYMVNKQFLNAYFIYEDILKLNPNLDEVIRAKNEAYIKLKNTAAEIEELITAKNFPGRNNFVFMLSKNRLMYTDLITKSRNKFYLFNIKIYTFDINYNLKNVIEAPYGETKSLDTFTLYSFSLINRNNNNLPIITQTNSNKETYSEFIFKLPASMNYLYNFSYDYEKTFNSSLIKLFKLYNLINENKNQNFSIGFNSNFIKNAITDKISHIFLFFSLNLIIISFSWRLRSNYLTGIPKIHLIIILCIPVFVYILVDTLQKYITAFYSTLTLSTNFILLLVICFIINIVIMLFSIIYIASTK